MNDLSNLDFSSIDSSSAGLGAVLGLAAGILIFVLIILIAVAVLEIIGMWKMFKKAGEPGWAAIIPFYNLFVLIKIGKLHWGHFIAVVVLALLSGYVNNDTITGLAGLGVLVYAFIIYIKAAKAFGKSAGFGVFTTFFPYIGLMILGCGKSEYQK